MRIPQICRELKRKISAGSPGRNLYSVLGTYDQLENFSSEFKGVADSSWNMRVFSLTRDFIAYVENKGLLDELVENERKDRSETVRSNLEKAVKDCLTSLIRQHNVLLLRDFELLYAYDLSFEFLWEWAKEGKKVVFLIPGEKRGETVYIFPWSSDTRRIFPRNLLKEEWIWKITEE